MSRGQREGGEAPSSGDVGTPRHTDSEPQEGTEGAGDFLF